MISKIIQWAKGLLPSGAGASEPLAPASAAPQPSVITLPNGRKASVDARGNFIGFIADK